MPELPEVETIVRGLSACVIGKRVEHVLVHEKRLRRPLPSTYAEWMQGQSIQRIERRAKYIILWGDRGYTLIHLGMSGRLTYGASDVPRHKHDHLEWVFEGDCVLRFNDQRRFGLVDFGENFSGPEDFLHLGPEPFSLAFDIDYLVGALKSKKSPIKSVLMDNRVVVGVGNIYAQEALFQAGIHPSALAMSLSYAQIKVLRLAVLDVLERAIAAGGSSIKDYVDGKGDRGYFQHSFKVYGKENELCGACREKLQKIKINQRSTVFCPSCQR